MTPLHPSQMDQRHLQIIRKSVADFMAHAAKNYAVEGARLLDIAPQNHAGARAAFPAFVLIETLDIDPNSGCDYIADITRTNSEVESERFDFVVCTEVLEHTLNPFGAMAEIYRLLRPGGLLFLTTPFNFRIHGPLPDCWRFTEHGLRELMRDFEIVELAAVETEDRPLMPIHYRAIAKKRGPTIPQAARGGIIENARGPA